MSRPRSIEAPVRGSLMKASDFYPVIDAVESALNLTTDPSSGLVISDGGGGRIISDVSSKPLNFSINSHVTAGEYNATLVSPNPAGTWVHHPAGVVGVVYERNGDAGVPANYVAHCVRECGEWRFDHKAC